MDEFSVQLFALTLVVAGLGAGIYWRLGEILAELRRRDEEK